MIISSSFSCLLFHWRCFNVSLFRQCSIVVLRCSAAFRLFRRCSVVPALFRRSAGVPCSVVPCSGVPGFIVCPVKLISLINSLLISFQSSRINGELRAFSNLLLRTSKPYGALQTCCEDITNNQGDLFQKR